MHTCPECKQLCECLRPEDCDHPILSNCDGGNTLQVKFDDVSESEPPVEAQPDTALVPTVPVPTMHVVARNAEEMDAARLRIHGWLTDKIAYLTAEITELAAAVEQATKQRWNRSALKRALKNHKGSRVFYQKCLAAVDAGYAIVPDFPVDIFAIRIARTEATPYHQYATWRTPSLPDQQPDDLPLGEGRYVSEKAASYSYSEQHKLSDGKTENRYYRKTEYDALRDVAFPMQVARTALMESTAEAMALKAFDQIGMCPQRNVKRPDPMIIGQIILRQQNKTKRVNFLLGWCLNLEDL